MNRVVESTTKVISNQAEFERDGVAFYQREYSYKVLSSILYVASNSKGHLNIIDFGGSLGSMYYQNKRFIQNLKKVSWNVVEQKSFVDVGKKLACDTELNFFIR